MIERELNVGDVFYSVEVWRNAYAVTTEHKVIDGEEWTRSVPRADSICGGIVRCTVVGKSTTKVEGDLGEYAYDVEEGVRYFAEITASFSRDGQYNDTTGQFDEWYLEDDMEFLTLEEAEVGYKAKRDAL